MSVDEARSEDSGSGGDVAGRASGAPARRGFWDWGDKRVSARWSAGIIAAWAAILLTAGLASDGPLLGDEPHHFTCARAYAEAGGPVWDYPVAMASGQVRLFRFNQPYFWHEGLAWVFMLLGGASFAAAQVYQTAWAALLAVSVWGLARSLDKGGGHELGVWALLLLTSIPMMTLFSIAFYVDMPLAAAIALGAWLLMRGRYLAAWVAAAFALLIKLPALIAFPGFILMVWVRERCRVLPTLKWAAALVLVVGLFHAPTALCRRDSPYPYLMVVSARDAGRWLLACVTSLGRPIPPPAAPGVAPPAPKPASPASADAPVVMQFFANHPGDLRVPVNWPRFLGVLLLPALAWAVAARKLGRADLTLALGIAVFWAGFAFLFATAPDVRYAMCAVALAAPLGGRALVGRGVWTKLFVLAAATGTALATAKVGHDLRVQRPDVLKTIDFLARETPKRSVIFMYPEGDRGLWPRAMKWYLPAYQAEAALTAPRAEESARILAKHGISHVVVKRWMIADRPHAPAAGYPPRFVEAIAVSPSFRLVFESGDIRVYALAPAAGGPRPQGCAPEQGGPGSTR